MVLRAREIDTWLASISKLVFSKSDRMLPDWLYDRLSHKTKLLLVTLVPLVEPSNQLAAEPSNQLAISISAIVTTSEWRNVFRTSTSSSRSAK